MEGVFWVIVNGENLNLLEHWGKIELSKIREHQTDCLDFTPTRPENEWLQEPVVATAGNRTEAEVNTYYALCDEIRPENKYDKYDKENLRLSGLVIRESLGPELFNRISSLISPTATGPEVFKVAIDQVMCMNATTIRTLSNQLGNLSLKTIPGENVASLTIKVSELAREIEGSGNAPSDLLHLVSKPHTKGTVDAFKTHALNTHAKVMTGDYSNNWPTLVTAHNKFYQDLVQSDECPPAKGGKSDDERLQAMIAKTVDQKLSRNGQTSGGNTNNSNSNSKRKCFNCGSTDHVVKDCPNKGKNGNNNNNNNNNSGGNKNDKQTAWRTQPPNTSKGEAKEKTVNGVIYEWCGKCRKNKGLWTKGDGAHFTEDHRSKTPTEDKKDSKDETGNLGCVNEPLEFGFFGLMQDHPKGCGGDY